MRVWTGLMLVALAVTAALAVGPKTGEEAPPLTIDAVNDGDEGEYELIEAAEGKPLVVLFLNVNDVEDERIVGVGQVIEEAYREHHEKGLQALIVVVGPPAFAPEVADHCQQNGIQTPVAVVSPDAAQLEPWDLGGNALTNLLTTIKEGRVRQVVADVRLPRDAEKVKAPLVDLLK